MDKVIVRFAPSPTGYLHIGGARTAIYNWLYARKYDGKFLLRIEDTDTERSSMDAISGIIEGLEWLGLDWDNDPYFQSEFTAEHQSAAQKLLKKGEAYKCFCSKAQLDAKRELARKNKTNYQYDGTCRDLTPSQTKQKEAAGQPYTIRFKVPRIAGGVRFDDLVYGSIEKKYRDIEDFIIVRANGQPLYVLTNAVDDIRDQITHIIRGQDGLANTPKQILIYQGLGASTPKFAHMSLTLDPKKAKISKRKHGEQVAVHYYRDHGFLPWAMVNFLVLLGWADADSQEFFTRDELIESFDLGGINRTNSVFNISADGGKHFTDPKLMSINAHYLRHMPMEELLAFIKVRLEKAKLWDPAFENEQGAWFSSTMDLIRGRFNTLADFETYGRAYICDDVIMADDAVRHNVIEGVDGQWMPALARRLSELENFDSRAIESVIRLFLKEKGVKPGTLMKVVRSAVTGQAVGPDFIAVLAAIGKERVVNRLISAAKSCT
jgi:glutamyl-tRNA synthetase